MTLVLSPPLLKKDLYPLNLLLTFCFEKLETVFFSKYDNVVHRWELYWKVNLNIYA